tara:strand:- start:106 stop:237 length:132 start_codon:yes stop_codon:yes gene_type:complete
MVEQHRHEYGWQWALIVSIAGNIGYSAQRLHNRATQAERYART